MEKVKRFPWLYLVIYNHCPVALYSTAWRALAHLVALYFEGFKDFNNYEVIRYRISRFDSSGIEREVVTDDFLHSLCNYIN